MIIAQMRIHLRLKTSADRYLQQAFDQLACIINGSRQLADQAGELKDFSISFSLISLTLAGSWFSSVTPQSLSVKLLLDQSLTHKLPDTLFSSAS